MGNDEKDYDKRDDYIHDRAREAVNRGEIIALEKLLETLQRQLPGDVIGLELENEHGNWIYEFNLINQQGYLLEVEVDAKSGKILSIEAD